MIKVLKKTLWVTAGIYILLLAGLYFFQESLLFLPSQLDLGYKYNFTNPAEEFNLENEGTTLNGLHFKVDNSKGVILYFHGNAGDLSRWGEIVQPLLKFKYDIVVMDYRGFGKNSGEFSESAMYEDAQVFYEYAKKQYDESEIVIYGRSLGTAFASRLAAKNRPSKLILETPFYSIASVAQNRFFIFPIDLLLKYRFENQKELSKVKCPILILLSENDQVVGYENGLRLAQEFPKAKTITLRNAGHNNQAKYAHYWKALEEFFKN